MSKAFKLKVVTPLGIALEEEVVYSKIPGKSGEIGVAPNHSPLLTLLKTGDIEIQKKDTPKRSFYFISEGLAQVTEESVLILCPYLECVTTIDKNRAEAAKERALKLLSDEDTTRSNEEREEAKRSLERAELRIDLSLRHK